MKLSRMYHITATVSGVRHTSAPATCDTAPSLAPSILRNKHHTPHLPPTSLHHEVTLTRTQPVVSARLFSCTYIHAHAAHTQPIHALKESSSACVWCAFWYLGWKSKWGMEGGGLVLGLVHCQSEVFFLCCHSEM